MKHNIEIHITSLVVHAHTDKCQAIMAKISEFPAAEVYTGEPAGEPYGKFIVLLETDNEQQILDAINRIQQIDGVLSASMVYHHID